MKRLEITRLICHLVHLQLSAVVCLGPFLNLRSCEHNGRFINLVEETGPWVAVDTVGGGVAWPFTVNRTVSCSINYTCNLQINSRIVYSHMYEVRLATNKPLTVQESFMWHSCADFWQL